MLLYIHLDISTMTFDSSPCFGKRMPGEVCEYTKTQTHVTHAHMYTG